MNKRKIFFLVIFFFLFLFTTAQTVSAFSFGDVIKGVKDFFSSKPPKKITVNSKIELAPNGDINNNGVIDGGDIVHFSYALDNQTDETYSYTTLKTNINWKLLNNIHNTEGLTGIDIKGNSLIVPNIIIFPHTIFNISFDARITISEKDDPILSTEPQLFTKKNELLSTGIKKELKTKHGDINKFPSQIEIENK